jgi:putative ABC transport system permease protein
MFSTFIKIAWRNLLKNRFYTLINIGGLAVGLAVGILILLWVQDEFSFNRFHRNASRIYKLENMVATGSNRQLWQNTAAPIGPLATQHIPGVQATVRMSYNGYYGLYKYNNKTFTEPYPFFTDAAFFTVFDFPLVQGNRSNPLPDYNSVVLTESTARKYFGDQPALGKIITADNKISFKVSGVIKDFPKNSDIQANMLFSMELLAKNMYAGNTDGRNLNNDFSQYAYNTYLLLQPGMSLAQLPAQLRRLHLQVKPDDTDIGYVLMPLKKMHLYRSDGGDGGLSTVRLFVIVAILILVIACINYVNLSTARSLLRAREVSMRKIIGAPKWQLFLQFVVETSLLFAFAAAAALVLVYTLIPLFNTVSGKALVIRFSDQHVWQVIGCTIAGTLILSSIYPALLLSSFNPLKALKGKITASISDVFFRKALVVTQFAFSVILITGTIIVGRQLSYMRSKQLGYDKDHVLSCYMINMAGHLDAIKASLMTQPGVLNVTYSNMNIVSHGGQTGNNSWDGKQPGETMMISPMNVDPAFISFFKLPLVAGTGFTGSGADSMHFILNETAVKATRLTDPVGKRFKLGNTEGTIIGVAKDFHYSSMRQKIQPAVFYCQRITYGQLYIKTTGRDAPKAIAALKTEWKKYNAGFPFDYAFLDDTYTSLYKSEQQTGWLFNIFSAIAIVIACLGLFGLAAYTAQVRTREIGVRKVLGAGVAGIIQLLTADFIKLVIISIVIAIPVSWQLMNKWLQDFSYRIHIGWMVFLAAGSIAIVIALITISFQSVKAAMTNPVKALRSE